MMSRHYVLAAGGTGGHMIPVTAAARTAAWLEATARAVHGVL